jgi:hypothetical protein
LENTSGIRPPLVSDTIYFICHSSFSGGNFTTECGRRMQETAKLLSQQADEPPPEGKHLPYIQSNMSLVHTRNNVQKHIFSLQWRRKLRNIYQSDYINLVSEFERETGEAIWRRTDFRTACLCAHK